MQLVHARSRIVLSGTPIQNDLMELWSLFQIIHNPENPLGNKMDFKNNFERPISLGRSTKAGLETFEVGKEKSAKVQKILREYYISRQKTSLTGANSLGGKEDAIILCEMSELQKEIYQYCLDLPDFDNAKYNKVICDCDLGQEKLWTRRECPNCSEYQYPFDRDPKLTYQVIDKRAVIWRQMHPNNKLCDRCPACVVLPCMLKLLNVSSHLALLQVEKSQIGDSDDNDDNEEEEEDSEAEYELNDDDVDD